MKAPRSSDHFRRRAEEERIAAENASDERARSHRELAGRYRGLADGLAASAPAESEGDQKVLAKEFRVIS